MLLKGQTGVGCLRLCYPQARPAGWWDFLMMLLKGQTGVGKNVLASFGLPLIPSQAYLSLVESVPYVCHSHAVPCLNLLAADSVRQCHAAQYQSHYFDQALVLLPPLANTLFSCSKAPTLFQLIGHQSLKLSCAQT